MTNNDGCTDMVPRELYLDIAYMIKVINIQGFYKYDWMPERAMALYFKDDADKDEVREYIVNIQNFALFLSINFG